VAQLTSIHRFPVKSCRGEDLSEAVVEPWGLARDRRWMVVDEAGAAITAREANHLLLVHPRLTDDGLRLSAPDLPDLAVATPDPAVQVPVSLWSSELTAAPAGPEADAWFTQALGRPARLVHLDDPTRRTVDPRFGGPDDRVSFADGYPLLLAAEESLAALNETVTGDGAHDPLPMARFRPSVVVYGFPAWAEDDWRRLRIGDAVFRAVKGCARCVITTLDPATAQRGREPIASLARHRRWDGATWFAINLVPDLGPDEPPPTIRVGDEVEVLEAVEPGHGPIRPAR